MFRRYDEKKVEAERQAWCEARLEELRQKFHRQWCFEVGEKTHTCPKCKSTWGWAHDYYRGLNPKYSSSGIEYGQIPHITWKCRNCGYNFYTDPADIREFPLQVGEVDGKKMRDRYPW